jgi:imidazolonepropionase-like amidohydrolase
MRFTGMLIEGLAIAVLLLSACNSAATPTPAPPTAIRTTAAPAPTATDSASMYAITDVAIVDVENGIAVPGQTVIVVGDRIDKIGVQGKLGIPEGAQIISGQGLYLMPGLVDAHVHYLDAPAFGRLMLANGVLLVRDMGMPTEYILPLRDELNRGRVLGPEMVSTGTILDGYPALIPSISLSIKTPEEGQAAVRQQAEAGVDMIKVYSRLDKDVFLAIVEEAQKQGLKVVGHIPDSVYIEDAAAAGLRSSEHFFGFEKIIAKLLGEPLNLYYTGMGADADYLQRLGEVNQEELQGVYQRILASGMTVCPTVITFKTATNMKAIQAGSFPRSEFISRSVLDIWKSQWSQQNDLPDYIWQNWAQMVSELNTAGVPLMVGTDLLVPGVIPGFSVHEEMAVWQDAGISPADVLRSATIVPTQFMGLGERLGSISEGKAASMVLVRANPLKDIRNAQQIEGVFLRGKYFSRTDTDRLLDEAKDLVQQSMR